MCLAIPMIVREVVNDSILPPVAVAESGGVSRKVRLDIVDRIPEPGDYVIVHAGFAIRTMTPSEAKESLETFTLMDELLENENGTLE